jgi:hypothetical protein
MDFPRTTVRTGGNSGKIRIAERTLLRHGGMLNGHTDISSKKPAMRR